MDWTVHPPGRVPELTILLGLYLRPVVPYFGLTPIRWHVLYNMDNAEYDYYYVLLFGTYFWSIVTGVARIVVMSCLA